MTRPSARLANAFKYAAAAMGWYTGITYDPETNRCHVGATFLQRAGTIKPLWQVAQIVNEGGGETNLSPEAMTSAELAAWLDGITYGHRAARSAEREGES